MLHYRNISVSDIKHSVRCAIEALSSEMPSELLKCLSSARKNYLEVLANFVKDCHELRRTEFFLLSGTPGVGKTFLVRYLMQMLAKDGVVVPVYVNCFELDASSMIHEAVLDEVCKCYNTSHRKIREKLGLSDRSKTGSQSLLELMCKQGWPCIKNDGDERIILLVLDEIDLLIENKEQPIRVIFSLLDLLRYPKSNLSLIGISNQVGIPAFREPKLLSRIHSQMIFKSYTENELSNLVALRMALYHGVIAPFLVDASSRPRRGLDIFSNNAMQMIFRSHGLQGDFRSCIHACKHVLIQFLEQDADKWSEVLVNVRQSSIFSSGKYNENDGLIGPEFTFKALGKIKVSVVRPELIHLPFLAYVVLAVCLRIELLRPKIDDMKEASQESLPCTISMDTIAEAMFCMAFRVRTLVEQGSLTNPALTLETAERLENFAGLRWIIDTLYQLQLIDIVKSFDQSLFRGLVRLNIEPKVLKRALEDPRYCQYSEFVKLI